MAFVKAVIAYSVFLAVTASIFAIMNQFQPKAYMDEVFHIPQAQKYCQGQFREWDPKITTLPGLYLLSIGILNPVSGLAKRFNLTDVTFDWNTPICSVTALRSVNLVLTMINLFIIHTLSTHIHGRKHYSDSSKILLSSLNMTLLPVSYFFTFLFYTDVGSTFLVLFMYCLHLENRNWLASFIGLLSVCFRQNNIIWVAFTAIQIVGPSLLHTIHQHMIETTKPVKFSLTTSGQVVELVEGSLTLVQDPRRLIKFLGRVILEAGGFIMVWLLFIAFVVWNDGIVVGDRTAHQVMAHPTQVFYFLAFTVGFSGPFCLDKVLPFLNWCRRRYLLVLTTSLVICMVIDNFSFAHPYLLADNRHYTFYLWRRIIVRTEWSKFGLAPLYLFGAFCIKEGLRKAPLFFKLAFPIFLFVSLCPLPLLEFRYFIIPFLLFRLQLRPRSWLVLWAETLFYVVVNAVTISLFCLKPFRWDHEPQEVQRFLW